ncbi:MAG TPA: sulfotransferase [Gammaproteobacteria bacterium]|nr:sulfotransferase [Gammaproteobacteria bacterium]
MSEAPIPQLFETAVDVYEKGDTERALSLAEDVLRRQPQHPGALYMTGSLLLGRGAVAEALPRLEQAARLQPNDGELLETLGHAYLNAQRWAQAVGAYRAAWQAGRRHPDLLNNLGLALKETGDVDGAIGAYQEAIRLASDDAAVHNNLAIALNRKHDYMGAIAAYRRSTELDPGNAGVWSNLATLYEQTNLIEEAEQALARGLAADPRQENLHLIAARCARRRGAFPEAVERLERELARPDLSPGIRRAMEFELGRDYDHLEDAAHAFPHFAAGNALTDRVWPGMRAGADAFLQDLDRRLAYFSSGLPAAWSASPPEERPSPVFLVSFPRSGTTLMDTILDAHPGVSVMEEVPFLENVVEQVRRLPSGYPQALATLDPDRIRTLRADYWREVDALLGPAARDTLVVDKNPFYSAHAAFIRLLFPGARFIFALRHPCDVVLSCFMQAFGYNPVLHNFRDLDNTAQTYRRVMDLWSRYRELLALPVHELRYEALVADKQKELDALLAFLGLAWEESMEDHTRHAKKRGRIYTPSYHQVIKPVYGDAVERWRRYRPQLEAVLPVLRPYIERFGYEA